MTANTRYPLSKYTLVMDSIRPGFTSTIEAKEIYELIAEFLPGTKVFRILQNVHGCANILEEHPVIGPKSPSIKAMNAQIVFAVETHNMSRRKFRITFMAGSGRGGIENNGPEQMREFAGILGHFILIDFVDPKARAAAKAKLNSEKIEADDPNGSFSMDFSQENLDVMPQPPKKSKKTSTFRDPRRGVSATVNAIPSQATLRFSDGDLSSGLNDNSDSQKSASQQSDIPKKNSQGLFNASSMKRSLSQEYPFMNQLFTDVSTPKACSQETPSANSQGLLSGIFSPVRSPREREVIDMNKTPDNSQDLVFVPDSPKKNASANFNTSFSQGYSSDEISMTQGRKNYEHKATQTDAIGDALSNPEQLKFIIKEIIKDPVFKHFVVAASDAIKPLEADAAKMGVECPPYSSAAPSCSQVSVPSSQESSCI